MENLNAQDKSENSYFQRSCLGIVGVLNIDKLTYDFISPNVETIFGYKVEDYTEGGIEFHLSTMQEAHANIIASFIIPKYLEYCAQFANTDAIKKVRFCYEFEVCTAKGKRIWCMYQSVVMETDSFGHPLKECFLITDISPIKRDTVINFSVTTTYNREEQETIYLNSYSTEDFQNLSNRELEIIRLLCEGKSTPDIADQLNLSEHTVKSHRKNIMQKLEVNNSIDIVKKALSKGLY